MICSSGRGKRPSRRHPDRAREVRQGCTECGRSPLRAQPTPTTTGAVENMRRLGRIRPRDLVPSPSLGGPPAGRQRVFVGASSLYPCKFPGSRVVASHRGGTGDRGSLSRLSPPVPGPRGSRGHSFDTPPRACSVSNATSQSEQCQAST